ncbi:hypothetical protein AB0L63_23565 [Nocardia sp. NPDC051990]|uniref:hypothetical protein n=1 Tax=Nocardia sp. NPDC051990 TaxID=3155285 RepID=UPI003413A2AE
MTLRHNTTIMVTASAIALAAAMSAHPASAEQIAPEVHYRTEVSGGTVATTIDAGSFAVVPDGRSILVIADDGRPIGQLPLAIVIANRKYEVRQHISADNRTLELLPDLTSAQPMAQPIASPLENQLAADDALSKMAQAAAVGPLAGAAAGAILGVVVAVASCAVLTVGCLLTGLPIIGVFAGGGGLAGTILAGLAAAGYGAWNYLGTLAAAPGESQYAKEGLGTNGAGAPDAHLRVPQLPSGSSSGSGATN